MKFRLRTLEQLESRCMLSVTPEFVADIRPGEVGSSIGPEWIEFRGEVYFAAETGNTGRELWKTDGTETGTRLVKDISLGETGSNPGFYYIFEDLIYFRADDGSSGIELWRTDGTEAGTERFLDLNPGIDDSFPGSFATFQDELLFRGDDGTLGSELYRTDGSTSGTNLVSDIYVGRVGSEPAADSGFVAFGDHVYFSADGAVNGQRIGTELYRTDGTTTELVLDADDGDDSSFPTHLTIFNGDLYFISEVPLPPFGVDFVAYLYRVDGSTGEVERFFPEPVDFRQAPMIIGDAMYFAGGGEATGVEIFRTDGTPSGTQLVKDVFEGEDSSRPQNFFAFGNRLFFSAGDSYETNANRVVHQIWMTEGTPETTIKLSSDTVDPETSFLAYRDEIYFQAYEEEFGWELYKSDGTVSGTGRVVDTNSGPGDGFGIPKLVFEDQLIYLADNGTNGFEIWTWNGMDAEMSEVHLGGGGFTSDPDQFQFIPYGNDLLFSGSTPFEGEELFLIRASQEDVLPGDTDGNGRVDFADFLVLSSNFGKRNANVNQGDFDGNRIVDFADFLILSGNFGKRAD